MNSIFNLNFLAENSKNIFEFMKNIAEVIVCHNKVMKEFLVGEGIDEKKIVVLEIFDYLQEKQLISPKFEKSITVAGNLDVEKCAYIKDLSKLNGINIHLYGPNFDEQLNDFSNIHYNRMHKIPSDDLIHYMQSQYPNNQILTHRLSTIAVSYPNNYTHQ